MDEVIWVVAGILRLPPSRQSVDLTKLAWQYRQFGSRLGGMPPLEVTRCRGDEMFINSGVTRATRAFRYGGPDTMVPVVVIERRPKFDATCLPKVSDAN